MQSTKQGARVRKAKPLPTLNEALAMIQSGYQHYQQAGGAIEFKQAGVGITTNLPGVTLVGGDFVLVVTTNTTE